MKKVILLLVMMYVIMSSVKLSAQNWVKSDSIANGYVVSIAANPLNGNMLAAVDGVGVFRSTDQGKVWTPSNTGLTTKLPKSVVYDANGKAYAGMNGSGVFISTDDGNSWNKSDSGMTNTNVLTLYIGSNGKIYAGTWFIGTSYMSTDNGVSWSDIGPAGNDVHSIYVDGSGNFFAGTDHNGLFKSTNGGTKWNFVGVSGVIVNSIIGDNNGNLFAGASDGAYISTDNGDHWNKTGLNAGLVRSLILSKNGYVFAATSAGVFRTTDNGASWKDFSFGLDASDLNTYSLGLNSDGVLYTGTYSYVYKAALPDAVKEDLSNDLAMTVYPLPSKTHVYFDVTLNNSNNTALQIFDALGNKICQLCNSFMAAGNHTFEFNPVGLPSGFYYYKLQSGTETKSGKIIYMP